MQLIECRMPNNTHTHYARTQETRMRNKIVSNVFLIWPPANQIHSNAEIPTDFFAVYIKITKTNMFDAHKYTDTAEKERIEKKEEVKKLFKLITSYSYHVQPSLCPKKT